MKPEDIDNILLDMTRHLVVPKEQMKFRSCLKCGNRHQGTRSSRICSQCSLVNARQGVRSNGIAFNFASA